VRNAGAARQASSHSRASEDLRLRSRRGTGATGAWTPRSEKADAADAAGYHLGNLSGL